MPALPAESHLFRSEYEQEMEAWLRRRFALLCLIFLTLELIGLTINGVNWLTRTEGRPSIGVIVLQVMSSLTILAFFVTQRRIHGDRSQTLNLAIGLILAIGSLSLAQQFFASGTGRGEFAGSLFFWHVVASLCLPWTPRESLRPMIALLAAWGVVLFITEPATRSLQGAGFVLLLVFAAALLLLPGLAISEWRLRRHGRRFHTRMIGKHFRSMRDEFLRARSIHESMFPEPHDDGHVRFHYTYTPMKEIGGDYIHLHVTPHGTVHMTLIDVTGHGLVAALTVNRLFGELERIRAESPDAGPGEVMALLNRYFYLTLQRHNIYATAIGVTLDPQAGELQWCNAGHPPAYLRGVNGTVNELAATETLLGALPPEEFDSQLQALTLAPGDIVVAYTDGAFEARNRAGEQIGIERLRNIVAGGGATHNWPEYLADAVDRHTAGRTEDDVLIAALLYQKPRSREMQRREERTLTGAGSAGG